METVRQLITATAVSKAGRNGALGCWSFSIPCGITVAAVTAVLRDLRAVFCASRFRSTRL
jgi:hypothetical protein